MQLVVQPATNDASVAGLDLLFPPNLCSAQYHQHPIGGENGEVCSRCSYESRRRAWTQRSSSCEHSRRCTRPLIIPRGKSRAQPMLYCIFSAIPTDTEGLPSSVPMCFVTVGSGVVKADRGNNGKTEFDKRRRRGRGTSSTAPREVGKKSGRSRERDWEDKA